MAEEPGSGTATTGAVTLPLASRPAVPNPPGRAVGWSATAAIAASILLMFAVSAAGPSAVVPALPQTWPAPPWWLPLHLSSRSAEAATVAAIILGALGVGCGLVAVRRGARPPARLLLAAGLTAIAVFTVLPPAGSSDSLSYAAYGRIAVIGRSPYLMTPAQLRASGDAIGRQTTRNWQDSPSLYGPLATGTEWVAAKLGGTSIDLIIFWLKVWLALAFGAVAVALDRLLRAEPAARARAHLLWTLNPLMLWAVMAGAHVDGLAAGLGFLGLIVARQQLKTLRALAAGLLIGLAAAVKLPFALFGIGFAWAARRSVPALVAAAAGAGLVLVVGYLITGPAALSDLRADGSRVALDSLWRVFYGFGSRPGWVIPAAALAWVLLAALLAWRLPPGSAGRPAIRPALAVSVAWLLIWPMQRAWYDAMAFCLLAAFPASRLDWLLLARSVPATLDMITAATWRPAAHRAHAALHGAGRAHPRASSWPHAVAVQIGRLLIPEARLAAVIAAVALCLTGAWGLWQPPPAERIGPVRPSRAAPPGRCPERGIDHNGLKQDGVP